MAQAVACMFWNVGQQPKEKRHREASSAELVDIIAGLVARHDLSVLVFAESRLNVDLMLTTLNAAAKRWYSVPLAPGAGPLMQVYVRLPVGSLAVIKPYPSTKRTSIHHLLLPSGGLPPVLLAVTHVRMRLYDDEHTRIKLQGAVAADCAAAEAVVGHRRTVLVGDLNDDPYSVAVVSRDGLDAAMVRGLCTRTGPGGRSCTFYNPMWGRLGDRPPGAPGTYYYDKGHHATYYWHTFDQVVLRPDAIGLFDDNGLRVLDQEDDPRLREPTGDGRPSASDHLPVVFRLRGP